MKTVTEVLVWCAGAERQFGDPSIPVGQMFVRLVDRRGDGVEGEDLDASFERDHLLINVFRGRIPLKLDIDGPRIDESGVLRAFGVVHVASGLWYLTPSLNLPGVLHAFVVVYDVPSPAPWERRIITLSRPWP